MARALWKGSGSFGLVNIPFELHAAVRDHRPRFRMLHAKDRPLGQGPAAGQGRRCRQGLARPGPSAVEGPAQKPAARKRSRRAA
jgi:hypothetical protein